MKTFHTAVEQKSVALWFTILQFDDVLTEGTFSNQRRPVMLKIIKISKIANEHSQRST